MGVTICGNASDSLYLTFKGGCRKDLPIEDAYRCTGCGGRFHKDCILEHFKLEASHDWGRQQERKQLLDELETRVTGGVKTVDDVVEIIERMRVPDARQ